MSDRIGMFTGSFDPITNGHMEPHSSQQVACLKNYMSECSPIRKSLA